MIHSLSTSLAEKVVNETNLHQEKIPYVAYGFEVILGGLVKFICFMFVPWLFGVLSQTLATVFSSSLLRYFSGGAHCTSLYRCLTSTLIIFTSSGLISKHIPMDVHLFKIITLLLIPPVITVLLMSAPADTPNKPILSAREKIILKSGSIVIAIIFFGILHLSPLSMDIKTAILLGIVIQVFTITKWGYYLIDHMDLFLSRQKGGVKNG